MTRILTLAAVGLVAVAVGLAAPARSEAAVVSVGVGPVVGTVVTTPVPAYPVYAAPAPVVVQPAYPAPVIVRPAPVYGYYRGGYRYYPYHHYHHRHW